MYIIYHTQIDTSYLAETRQLDVHAGTQTGAQVAGARQHVAEMLVPHELPALALDLALDLQQSPAEAFEDGAHVAALLHRDDASVVLFVDPDQEVLVAVMPRGSDNNCTLIFANRTNN